METIILWILATVVTVLIIVYGFFQYLLAKRRRYIDQYRFPDAVVSKLSRHHPELSQSQIRCMLEGLREYFHVCNMAGGKMVSMPSQAVDNAWHEFILFTREYQRFCKKAFGRFLHHTPAEGMSSAVDPQAGLKRAWRLSCERAGINPAKPASLPLLFAVDTSLAFQDGFAYSLDKNLAPYEGCSKQFLASNIGCGGYSGSARFSYDSSSSGMDSACSSGCGGGCGS